MNISLELVDEVRSRTGATYEEAKRALVEKDGDVLEAIILIEEKDRVAEEPSKLDKLGLEFVEGLKELINKGNVTKIVLYKEDKIILNIPVTAGALGAVFFTSAIAAGIIAALATGCRLDIIKEDGDVIDICEITEETINKMKSKIQDCKEKVNDIKPKKDGHKEEMFETEDDEEEEIVINLKINKEDIDKDENER